MTDQFHDPDTLVVVSFEKRRGSYRPDGVRVAVHAGSLAEAIRKAHEQHPDLTPVAARAVHLRWYDPAPFANFYRWKSKPC